MKGGLYRKVKPEVKTEEDTISRQAAVEICEKTIDLWNGQLGSGALMAVKERMQSLPSAESRRKMGKWIDTDNYYQRWKCSICGGHTRDAKPPYCPNCGAKMEECG